jgi:hypothetical protein
MAVTPGILHELMETDLSDEALQILIDDAVGEVETAIGPLTTRVKEFDLASWWSEPEARRLQFVRPLTSVISISEGYDLLSMSLVDMAKYSLRANGMIIEKLDGVWARYVKVTYVPLQDVERRDGVVIDLCKLMLQYQGLRSESAGDYSATHVFYERERTQILRRLFTAGRLVV